MKIPAPVCQGGHTHGVLWSPSLQRLTNDSPRCNDWLSSKTLAPIESAAKRTHPMQQKKSPTYHFSTPPPSFLERFKGTFLSKTACLSLLTISPISVPAGQSRHACRALRQIWQACLIHALKCTNQLTDWLSNPNHQCSYLYGAVKPVPGGVVLLWFSSPRGETKKQRGTANVCVHNSWSNSFLLRYPECKLGRSPVGNARGLKWGGNKHACHLTTPHTSRPTQQVFCFCALLLHRKLNLPLLPGRPHHKRRWNIKLVIFFPLTVDLFWYSCTKDNSRLRQHTLGV